MAKETYKFYKLGNPNTTIFHDSMTGLKVTKTLPGKLSTAVVRNSKKIRVALGAKHLAEINEAEYEEMVAKYEKQVAFAQGIAEKAKAKLQNPPKITPEEEAKMKKVADLTAQFKAMNQDQCYTHFKDNYDVSEEELAEFKALKKGEMVEELVRLEIESE